MLIRFAFVTAFNAQEVGGNSPMADKLKLVSGVVRSIPAESHIVLGGSSLSTSSFSGEHRISLADSEGKSYNAFSDCRGTTLVAVRNWPEGCACEVSDEALPA